MDNKKLVLKKEIKKVSKPNLYNAEQIRKIKINDDIADNESVKVDMSKAPSPFKMIRNVVKGGIEKYKKFAEEQRRLDKEAYDIQKERRGGPLSNNELNVQEFLNIRKKLKEQKKQEKLNIK